MRRGYPIHGYVGPNGSGKTAAMVWDTLPSLDAGRTVLSTVRLLDHLNPRLCDDPACQAEDHATHMAAHPCWVPWTTWRQLLEVEHADVLADEVTGVASSRESQSMPAPIANALVQLRRRDVVLRWSAPNWARCDAIIRECSQAATFARGYLPKAVPGSEGEDRAWRHRRLFKWLTYDASMVDEFTQGKRERMRPWVRDFHWGPGSESFSAYDTFDAVSAIGTVSDHGRCMGCGGRRAAPACSCSDYEPPSRARPAAARGPRSRGGAATDGPAEELVSGQDGLTAAALSLVPGDSAASAPGARRALLP